MKEFERPIAEALGTSSVPSVSKRYLFIYRQYITKRFHMNTLLTGREDFQWEEPFLFGYGKNSEYERLKRTRPSYKDKFLLTDIKHDELIQDKDLIAVVVRQSDHKRFEIGLSWLTTMNKKAKAFRLLNDYATWIANCC